MQTPGYKKELLVSHFERDRRKRRVQVGPDIHKGVLRLSAPVSDGAGVQVEGAQVGEAGPGCEGIVSG